MNKLLLIVLLSTIANANLSAQDPHRFDGQIQKFTELSVDGTKDLAVFTGSSSIRLWKSLDTDCQGKQIINTGFGGSHMSDLLYFLDQTVLRFQPTKVYIYEGDNDLSAGKEPRTILKTAKRITDKILESNPITKIYFIAAKPSPSRWSLKEKYMMFNALLKEYSDNHNQVFYVDVWNAMLNGNGRVNPSIFKSDSLHMNRQGYIIWKDLICKDAERK